MLRFLRYLFLHLLVLTGLWWLGWQYARLSDREVRLLSLADEAIRRPKEPARAANRAYLFYMERKAEETHFLRIAHLRDTVRNVYADVDSALAALQRLEQIIIRKAGNSAASRYAQPDAAGRVLYELLFDEEIQAQFDTVAERTQPLRQHLMVRRMDVEPYRIALPQTRWQRFRMFGGLPLAGVLLELSRIQRSIILAESEVMAWVFAAADNATGGIADCFAAVNPALDFTHKLISGELAQGEMYLVGGSCDKYRPLPGSIVFQGRTPVEYYRNNAIRSRLAVSAMMPETGYDRWGRSQQSYQATQALPRLYPYQDTLFTYNTDCIVTRPRFEIKVNQQPLPLYRHCRNRLHLYHQMPPPEGTPPAKLVRVKGGRLLSGPALPELAVVADQPQVFVTVLDPFDGSVVRTDTFGTVAPPAPTLRLLHGTKAVDLKQGVAAGVGGLRLTAVADADFAAALPQEARYRATARVTLYRRGRVVGSPERISGEATLRQLPALAQPGDWYAVEATRVERLDGEGKAWPEAVKGAWVVPVY